MVIVLFGVSGAGKTTLGRLLAAELGWRFYDGDDYHCAASVEKMRRGIPLTDVERRPWLEKLRALIDERIANGENAVLACSALKESFRRFLRSDRDEVKLVYLQGNYSLMEERLMTRHGHFMNSELLQSQFDTLEEPAGDTVAIAIDQTPPEIVEQIRKALKL